MRERETEIGEVSKEGGGKKFYRSLPVFCIFLRESLPDSKKEKKALAVNGRSFALRARNCVQPCSRVDIAERISFSIPQRQRRFKEKAAN